MRFEIHMFQSINRGYISDFVTPYQEWALTVDTKTNMIVIMWYGEQNIRTMTSQHNALLITVPCWGEFADHRSPKERPMMRSVALIFSLLLAWTSCWRICRSYARSWCSCDVTVITFCKTGCHHCPSITQQNNKCRWMTDAWISTVFVLWWLYIDKLEHEYCISIGRP